MILKFSQKSQKSQRMIIVSQKAQKSQKYLIMNKMTVNQKIINNEVAANAISVLSALSARQNINKNN